MSGAFAAVTRRGAGDEGGERLSPDGVDVFLGLERHAERGVDERPGPACVASSAASAATQSSVSDTPGTLYSSLVRNSCTSAVTCAASCAEACGTRALTIASSLSKAGYSIHW